MPSAPFHAQVLAAVWKTAASYGVLLTVMRITGKRELGALSAIDLVGFIMISEAALIAVADPEMSFLVGITPVLVLGVLLWTLPYVSLKSHRLRVVLEGRPSIVVAHGRIDDRCLRALRYNLADLMAEIRNKNLTSLADVEFAVLETTGKLSVVPRAGARSVTADDLRALQVTQADPAQALGRADLPADVVLDGRIDHEALARTGHNKAWLQQQLHSQGFTRMADVLLASVDSKGTLTARGRNAANQGRRSQTNRA